MCVCVCVSRVRVFITINFTQNTVNPRGHIQSFDHNTCPRGDRHLMLYR